MGKALPYVLFAALTLVEFLPFLLKGESLHDTRSYELHLGTQPEIPGRFFQRPAPDRSDTVTLLPSLFREYNEGLKSGELRLWNPNLFCGYPVYADPMVHAFYPPHLLLHAALPPLAAYEATLMLHLFFAGAATYWLLGGMGRSRAAATVGGVIWMLASYNSHWFSTLILAGASVFLPLAILAVTRAMERREPALAALGGLAMGMVILGSHPQIALLSFAFAAAWTVARIRTAPGIAAIFLAVSLGTGLVELVARLDSIMTGERLAGSDLSFLYDEPVLPLHLLDLAFGKVNPLRYPLSRVEFAVYAGVAATTLAVVGALRGPKLPAIFGGVILLVVFIPPLASLANMIPLLNLSLPTRWLFILGFCVALLAARGFDALSKGAGRAPLVLSAAAALFLLAWPVLGFKTVPAVETLIGLGLAAGAAFAAGRRPRLALGLCMASG